MWRLKSLEHLNAFLQVAAANGLSYADTLEKVFDEKVAAKSEKDIPNVLP